MILDFLAASDGTPLTKTFAKSPLGGYDVEPYPFVRLFDSHRVDVSDISEFHDALQQYAAAGMCLLKGELTNQLRNEARQGMTSPSAATSWLCLDLDFQDGWASVEDFLYALDPGFDNVSYIWQHSASAGIKYAPSLRGHVFVMLETQLLPTTLKLWLRARNLAMTNLRRQLALTASGAALRWPLDVTTCQNDKLLYIAPPQCADFDDPLDGQRLRLVLRRYACVSKLHGLSTVIPATVEQNTKTAVNELREAAGLEAIRTKYREARGVEYLANPDGAIVTGAKTARGFVYINLNGGDSWAYYFPEDNPEFLFNFKGEPIVRLKDIAPDFYKDFRAQRLRAIRADRDFTPLVFRDRNRDVYYNVLKYEDRVEYAKASSLQKLQHFMLQFDEAPPEIIPDWEVTFDPTRLDVIDDKRRWMNTFQPSPYLLAARNDSQVACPQVIYKIVLSVCGNDAKCADHFLNWLAFIFQTRRKTGTGWIFHGVHGTGKGVLISRVIKPLLMPQHVLELTGQLVEDQFNGPLETALVVAIDEFHHESARSSGTVMNKLKNMITEPRIAIRGMQKESVMVDSYCNIIINTNHPDPVALATTDRRFNVPPAQEVPLRMTEAEIAQISEELQNFADYLMSREVDEEAVRRIIYTEARSRMISASQTSVERFFDHLRNGDLGFFLGFASVQMPMFGQAEYIEFDSILRQWVKDHQNGRDSEVTLQQIRGVYHYIIGAPTAPAKIKRMLDVYRVPHKDKGNNAVTVKWAIEAEELELYQEQRSQVMSQNVQPIRAA